MSISIATSLLPVMILVFACAPVGAAEEETGIINANSPEPGILFGGQPTAEQLQKLAAEDYKTVIDLRGPTENRGYDEPAAAAAAGLEYISIPITGDTIKDPATLDRFIATFRDQEKPVLVHCASGGRVGAVYYAWLVAEGKMSRDEALAKAREHGMKSDTLVAPIDQYLAGRKSE